MLLKSSSCWLILSCFFLTAVAYGELPTDQVDPSLASGSSPVWYNEDQKTLHFPTAETLQAAEDALKDRHRKIYVDPPAANPAGKISWWDPIVEVLSSLIPWLLWGLLATFLISTAVYLWMAAEGGRNADRRRRSLQTDMTIVREKAKIVDLPFSLDGSTDRLYEQAQLYRRNGDYSKSIIYLFSHTLVELDNANCIRLQRGKTNQSYLQELKNEPDLRKIYQHTVRVFEAVFFGGYSVNQEQCERFWNLLPTFQQAIQEAVRRRTTAPELKKSVSPSLDPSGQSGITKLVGLVLLVTSIGCDVKNKLPTDNYGGSNAYSQKSVSGLTVFRELCKRRHLKTHEVISLSQRFHKLDVIVWAPKDFRVPNDEEIAWFDNWLSTYPARKLIFVGRDYSPLSHYWGKAVEKAVPEDRRTYRLQQAYADLEHESARMSADSPQKCAWFEQQFEKDVGRRVEKFEGPWAKDFNAGESDIFLRGKLMPVRSTKRNSSTSMASSDPSVVETVLASSNGYPIVSVVSNQRWGASQLILVANGSLLMNEAITNRSNHQIAEKIVNQCEIGGKVGFLSTSGPVKIRQPWDEQEPKGFEWLRIWPLSLIAIQGLFLGSIVLLAMLPIFGRPQRLPSPSTTDFGKHIEALGELLAQTRDRNYARQRIADYFRDVRRDSASPWATSIPSESSNHTTK